MKTLGLLIAGILALPLHAAELPPLNSPPTSDYFAGKFVWADLFTADQNAAERFYTGLFGWTASYIARDTTAQGPHTYIVLSNDGLPVAGIALLRADKMPGRSRGRWIHYISVPDVQQALAAAISAGSQDIFPAKDLPQRGTQAIIRDPQGALVGLIHSASGDPGEYMAEAGEWTWMELFASNPSTAAQFYQTIFGYESAPDERTKRPDTFLLSSGTYARASVAPMLNRPNAHPAWLGYIRVQDLAATLARVPQLGGRILVGAQDLDEHNHLAIIADSVGAAVGLVEHSEPPETASGNTQPPATP